MGNSLLLMGRWAHSSIPTKIILIYIIYELIIFMGCLVREPERIVQGVVNDSRSLATFSSRTSLLACPTLVSDRSNNGGQQRA